MASNNTINIQNKKARFAYEILETYTAGLVLTGTEIKSIRLSKASIAESFCQFIKNDLFIVNMNIEPYAFGTHANHQPKRQRKVLLHKKEIKKLEKKVQQEGLAIVPIRLFISTNGWCKVLIALAKGKKTRDKRETIRKRESQIKINRVLKSY